MFENEFYVAQLVAARIKGSITAAQQSELDAWVDASEENAAQYRKYIDERKQDENLKKYYDVDSAAVFKKIKGGIAFKSVASPKPKIFNFWMRVSIAAAIFLMVAAGAWFINAGVLAGRTEVIQYAGDAAPGKEGATLTLANGKKIKLSVAGDGELAKEAGVTITKTADGQLIYEIEGDTESNGTNILSTANGETYQVKLPDGSRVWLNASSSLTYRASLNDEGFRRVKLAGEAYFEIEKNAERPFIVESAGQEVKVLGTHFNIKAYQNESSIKTTLLEGSISLQDADQPEDGGDGTGVVLKPGEQAINNGYIKIEKADLQEAIAWKEGNTVFKNKPLKDIMSELARWYDVNVVYEANAPKDVTFSGAVSRSRNISSVLERMQTTGSVKFEIDGKTIRVMK